ncbi:MAG TPA: SRPBCC family protein [Solirubrobacteraceae bacterium]|nr:SRPBCC family protein [Solirubrobacteraceae bacterium]
MPTARRTRTIAASPQEVWRTISDPHHLPRWWPRVGRVEDVRSEEFTELLQTKSGKYVRADFAIAEADQAAGRLRWEQRVEGSPFERILARAETTITLTEAPGPDGPSTEVAIELDQTLKGGFPRFFTTMPKLGSPIVKRAAARTLDEALEGLDRICGRA